MMYASLPRNRSFGFQATRLENEGGDETVPAPRSTTWTITVAQQPLLSQRGDHSEFDVELDYRHFDLFFDPDILDELLDEPGNVLAFDSSARGESRGLLKFDTEGARVMLATTEQLIADGQENAWVIEATRMGDQSVVREE